MPRLALPLFFGLALVLSWAVCWPLVAEHLGWGLPVTPDLHLLGSLGPAAALLVSAWLGRGELGRGVFAVGALRRQPGDCAGPPPAA